MRIRESNVKCETNYMYTEIHYWPASQNANGANSKRPKTEAN